MATVTIVREEEYEVDMSMSQSDRVLYLIREDGVTIGIPLTKDKYKELEDFGVGTQS